MGCGREPELLPCAAWPFLRSTSEALQEGRIHTRPKGNCGEEAAGRIQGWLRHIAAIRVTVPLGGTATTHNVAVAMAAGARPYTRKFHYWVEQAQIQCPGATWAWPVHGTAQCVRERAEDRVTRQPNRAARRATRRASHRAARRVALAARHNPLI